MASHIAQIRGEGFADYTVRPSGQRDSYSAIVFLEPLSGRNLRAFGYDMFAEPVRRAAMEQASDTGRAALSGKVILVQETDAEVQAGTLMYVPVYRRGAQIDSPEARRAALLGWVYSPFRMNDLMRGILSAWQDEKGKGVDLHIYDGDTAREAALMFDGNASRSTHADPFIVQQKIDLNGRAWLLEFHQPEPVSVTALWPAWLVLLSGFALSGLLFGLLRSLLHTRQNADRIAARLTAELHQHERWLAESEERSKFALDGSGLGVWDWQLGNDTVYFSHFWKAMLGYQDHEIGNDLNEWRSRCHPDDWAATEAAVKAALAGDTPYYDNEHRLRCKDGSYKWIRDRGMVVARDAQGRPLRMIGTHSDISEYRRLMNEREEYFKFFKLSTEPMCIADPFGCFKRVNPAFAQLMNCAEDELIARPFIDFVHPDDREATRREMELQVAERPTLQFENRYVRADGSVLDLAWVAYFDKTEGVTYATARDVTASKLSEARIRRLTQLYAALSHCNSAIVRCTSRRELFAKVCQVVVDDGGMALAWMGTVDEATGSVVSAAQYGSGQPYLDGIEISVRPESPYGHGPTGRAIRENQPVWLERFMENPATAKWHERAAPYGWKSSAALPISCAGKVVGALTFYSQELVEFDAEVRALLLEMAADVSHALDVFDSKERAQKYQETLLEAEHRFRCLVEQSLAGAYIVQNGRFVYVNPRCAELLGYQDPTLLFGHDLLSTVAPKDRAQISTQIRRLITGEQSSFEAVFTVLRMDGSTLDVGANSSAAVYQGRPAMIGLMQDVGNKRIAEEHISRYTRQLEKNFMQTVGLATTLSEMRDPYTVGHERRVAELAVAIGREMGLDKDRLEGLRVGGYLHDVGKMVVPVEILVKPTRLTPYEYALIKEHPKAGYEVLKDVDFPWPVAQIAYQHHERMDGSGYPRGLKGEEIMLEARIAAVADVIESMASHRPYRAGLGIEVALAEIEKGRGSLFDPRVVDVALALFREKGYVLPD